MTRGTHVRGTALTEKQVTLILEIQRQLKASGVFSVFTAANAPESLLTQGWVSRVDVRDKTRRPRSVYGILRTLMREGHITTPRTPDGIDWTRVEVLTPIDDTRQVNPRGVVTHHHLLGGGRTVLLQSDMVPGATSYGICARRSTAHSVYEGDIMWLNGSVHGRPKAGTLYAVQVTPGVLEPGHVLPAVTIRSAFHAEWYDPQSVADGAPVRIEGVIQHLRVCAVLSTNMKRGGECQEDPTKK